ncbi:hypothetical protein Cni_G00071 [Canna indica]|uniref:Uncharacterized protein n=1 Tax=Canna indica TaxID=4628 RepID=A0AAQ3PVX5_9LILI|nr:hypothetical protein Cni_G00071 [Canna indica]
MMSGAQGAQPVGSRTPTTYESVPEKENESRLDLRSNRDESMIKVDDELQKKLDDAVGKGGSAVDATSAEHKGDPGVTGTG